MGDSNYKSETTETTQLTAIASDGTHIPIEGTKTIQQTNYSIKKLNSRIFLNKGEGMQDLFTTQASICSSSKNIKMFRELLVRTDNQHILRMSAKKFAELMKVTRNTASTFFKKCTENNLLHKMETNEYLVNPYLFTPIGAKGEIIEKAQLQWAEIELQSDLKDPEVSGMAENARKLIDEYALTKPLALLLKNSFFLSILSQYRDGKRLSQKQVDTLVKQFKE
jgi:hypothetical protein